MKPTNHLPSKWGALAAELSEVVEKMGLQQLQIMDRSDEELIETVLTIIDNLLQYSENMEVKEQMFDF